VVKIWATVFISKSHGKYLSKVKRKGEINLLAPEFDISILAHPVYKM
jgi:hypothetical protein